MATPWQPVSPPPALPQSHSQSQAPATPAPTRAAQLASYLAADPGNLSLMLDLAGELHATGQLEQALQLAEEALALAPDSSLAAALRVLCLLSQSQVARAREAHRLFMATWTSLEAARRFQWVFQRAGQPGSHVDDLELLLGASSLDRARRRLLIRALHLAGQPVRALHHLQTLMARVGTTDADDAALLALLLFDAGQLPQAGAQARQCLQRHPAPVEALYVAASLCLLDGQMPLARQHLDQALTLQPEDGRCLSLRGQLALAERQYGQAARWLARAAQQMPAHVGSRLALGWCGLLMGDGAAATAAFDAAVALNPNAAEAHGALAVLAAWQGRPQDARRHITRARRLDAACHSAVLADKLLAGDAGGPPGRLHDELITVLQQLPAVGGHTMLQFYRRLAPRTSP